MIILVGVADQRPDMAAPDSIRRDRIGPVLSFHKSAVAIVEGSFHIVGAEKSSAGYTVYKVQFKVSLTRVKHLSDHVIAATTMLN